MGIVNFYHLTRHDMDEVIDLLEQSLEEEKNADRLLTEIAEGEVNDDAAAT